MATLKQIAIILREQAKWGKVTQETLHRDAGISRQTLTNVLSGNSDYKMTTFLAVIDRLGIDVVLLPKEAARGLADDLAPRQPEVKTGVQVALERIHGRDQTR